MKTRLFGGPDPAKRAAEPRRGIGVPSWRTLARWALAPLAGLVVARQRPATAKGVTFMLLEDEHGAINLAQGMPDFSAPEILKEAACTAIRDDINQYAVTWGAPSLRHALARKYGAWYDMDVDPDREIPGSRRSGRWCRTA